MSSPTEPANGEFERMYRRQRQAGILRKYYLAALFRFFVLDREFGILPMRGSPSITNSQARTAACSKSLQSEGSTCHAVSFFPNRPIERMLGNSRRRLS